MTLKHLRRYNRVMAGKPKKPEQVKSFMLRIRVTEAERTLLEQAAALKSLQMSSWIRSEMLAQARKLLAANRAKGGD